MNGFSLVVYVKDYELVSKEELSSLYYRFSDYCLEHIINYELIVLTPSSLDVSAITKYFKSINAKNNVRVYKCNEKFKKVAEFMITVGSYNTQIFIDYSNYSKSGVGLELMLSDFIKYESPCCIGLYKDNNASSDSIICIIFNRNYIYQDISNLYVISINELFRQLLCYFSYKGVALRYNGIVSNFKLFEITIPFRLVEKIRRFRFIYYVRNNYFKQEHLNRLKYKINRRKMHDKV